MSEFSKGDRIELEYGGYATIVDDEPLGHGGQGEVYRVDYNGKRYALKWYTASSIISRADDFKKNIDDNILSGPPQGDTDFLWPRYSTKFTRGSFGYLMDLIPKNMTPFVDILNTYRVERIGKTSRKVPVNFSSLDAMVMASINIVRSFRQLHRAGKSYQDLNDGGFFFNLDDGRILVCDCDNVAPDGTNNGINGKPGYMAPEVVTRKSRPNMNTDKFSLAVILFKLLMRGNPFEGAKVHAACVLTGAKELEFYGTDPTFIFNPKDDSNRPVRGVDNNVLKFWGLYPQYIRDMFIRAFTDGLHDPSKRPIDNEWMGILMRLRSEIVACQCGRNPIFMSYSGFDGNSFVCPKCGNRRPVLAIGNYYIPLVKGAKLYAYQTVMDSEDLDRITGEVIENSNHPGVFGLRNIDDVVWMLSYESGKVRALKKGETAGIDLNMKIDFGQGIKGVTE